MRIADLIPEDKDKLVVYRWPESDEFEVGRLTHWDQHSVYVLFRTRRGKEERACSPQFVRLLQGQP